MPMPAVELEVGNRTVRVTSPDKIYFPDVGLTKLDIVSYVIAVGDGIFAALKDRPVTMERWPGGYRPDVKLSTRSDHHGEAFYQKRAPSKGMPDWVETVTITFPSGRTPMRSARLSWQRLPGWRISARCATTLGR
jgi:DNA primase